MSPALLTIIATLALSTAASTPPTALERGAPTQDDPFDAIVEQMREERQEEIGRTSLMRRDVILENYLANYEAWKRLRDEEDRSIAVSLGLVGGALTVVLPLATVFGLWRWRPRSLRWQVIRAALWPAAGLSFMIGGAAASAVGSAIYSRPLIADRHIAWTVTWLVVSLLLGGVGGVIAWSAKVNSKTARFDPAVGHDPMVNRRRSRSLSRRMRLWLFWSTLWMPTCALLWFVVDLGDGSQDGERVLVLMFAPPVLTGIGMKLHDWLLGAENHRAVPPS